MKTSRVELLGEQYDIGLKEYKYPNDRLAIVAMLESGEIFGKITVNIPELELEVGEFFVKTYSENTWVTQLLGRAWFVDTGKEVENGFVRFRVWRKGPQYPL